MTPSQILQSTFQKVLAQPTQTFLKNADLQQILEKVVRCGNNRALTRLLMACTLAKIGNSKLNVCKPYTEIPGEDSFSGRNIDETWISPFIFENRLPCNATTAFLTPALRNITEPLSSQRKMAGNDPKMYEKVVEILERIQNGDLTARNCLAEILRILCLMKKEREERLNSLLAEIRSSDASVPLSSAEILKLVQLHLSCKYSSRLPVLVVAAAYHAVMDGWNEKVRPLNAHNAADLQTGAQGDVEVFLAENENSIVTAYEMKTRSVTIEDVNIALEKIRKSKESIQNYLFVTTVTIDAKVQEYAADLYQKTGGVEIAILDCLGFLNHFLHFFHRSRLRFLEEYQSLLLQEPDSAVSQELKETFLTLRKTAEIRD